MSRCKEKSIPGYREQAEGGGWGARRESERESEGGVRETAASQKEQNRAAIKHRGTFSSIGRRQLK